VSRRNIVFLFVFCVFFSCVSSHRTLAEDTNPKIKVVLSNGNDLVSDLRYLVDLTDEKSRDQWSVLKDYIDIFLMGINLEEPISFDVKVDPESANGTARYVPSFPVLNFDDFRTNLDSFGVESSRRTRSLYKLKMANKPFGWLRFAKNFGYAVISEDRGEVPLNIGDPKKTAAPLVADGNHLGALMTNATEGLDERRKSFASVRKELLAAIKRGEKETKPEFELRKVLTEQQIDEAERIFVEAERLSVKWTLEKEKGFGNVDIVISALPDTDLARTIQEFSQKKSQFANLQGQTDSILSGRINHPLDAMRQKHFIDIYTQLQARSNERIDASDTLSDAEKNAFREATGVLYEMLISGAKAGLLDAFIDVWPNGESGNQMLAGIVSVDGNKAIDILKKIPDIGLGYNSELDLEKHEDISIHKVTLPKERRKLLIEFLGGHDVLYIGTGDKQVWAAGGENALTNLKTAITSSKKEPADTGIGPIIDLRVNLKQWIELTDDVREKNKQEGRADLRKRALEAFAAGDGIMTMRFDRAEKEIRGKMNLQPGILRFVGSMITKFSKEQLE